MKISRNISITLVCIILGITLAWQYQSVRNNAKVTMLEAQRKDDLIQKLLNEKENNENLRKKNDELNTEIRKYENSLGDNDENIKLLKSEINKLRVIAGLTEVKGRGVIITISKDEMLLLRDYDLLDILNELRASDAQALAINEERIVSTSEVRVAGGNIIINGRQVQPPFIIKAIADPGNVENAFKMMGGVAERIAVYFVNIVVEKSDEIVIPKVRDEVIRTDMLKPVEQKQ
ncbi:MAG: DUF881 domain-containing protein [Clostridia bacterium]|nr:DUF881 domain-containing protein [Clostridia bacterium]